MSDLTTVERVRLEKLFDMAQGYVLNFYNSTFEEFILENSGIEIYDDKYATIGDSKAKRLRSLWKIETNHVVGNLILKLIEYGQAIDCFFQDDEVNNLIEECQKIGQRLKNEGPVENIDYIKPNTSDKDFDMLARSIRLSIESNQPEASLDRLHTFVVRYVREMCKTHGVDFEKDLALHSLFGKLIKQIKSKGIIESLMTERILKSSISILEAFNDVRNNQSFAHDNPVLNYNESILIFNNVSNAIRFLETITAPTKETEETEDWDDFPF